MDSTLDVSFHVMGVPLAAETGAPRRADAWSTVS